MGMKVAEDKRATPGDQGCSFRMREHRHGACVEMLLHGAIEKQAAQHLLTRVQCAYPVARAITLDLTNVTFMDSSGLYALLQTKAICGEHDIKLVLHTDRNLVPAPRAMAHRSHPFL